MLGENRAPPPRRYRQCCLFKLAFWRLSLSTPKRCHMDLWLARLVLTHHHLHRPQHLPSASITWSKSISIPVNKNHPAVNKHHTADSTILVLVKEARAYYHHRHSGISGTNFSMLVKQTARQLGDWALIRWLIYFHYH